jgi:hypothetical protein
VNQDTAMAEAEIRELRRRAALVDTPASTEPQVKARLRLAPPVPVSVPRTPFIILVVLVVIAGVWGILVLNTKINENAFKLDDLRTSQNELDLREQELKRYIADKESPGNLAALATLMGQGPADVPAFILLPDGKIIGVPKPAPGPTSPASQP